MAIKLDTRAFLNNTIIVDVGFSQMDLLEPIFQSFIFLLFSLYSFNKSFEAVVKGLHYIYIYIYKHIMNPLKRNIQNTTTQAKAHKEQLMII